MRLFIKCIAIIFIISVSSVIWFFYGFYRDYSYSGPVIIEKGDSLSSFISKLPDYPYSLRLKILFYFKGGAERIQKGRYDLSAGHNCFEIHDMITSPSEIEYSSFTIVPGENMRMLEKRIYQRFSGFPLEETLAELKKSYDIPGRGYEGILYPDTYFYNRNSQDPGEEVLELAVRSFRKNIYERYSELPEGLDFYQTCILASIVESEGRDFEEKKKIAGVFLNRLEKGMNLESCATVQYVLPKKKKRLLYKDLEISSPYNTYIAKGLPPSPICFFSESSMKAVLEYEDHDYLYFVLNRDGTHTFTRTLTEHNRAKKRRP